MKKTYNINISGNVFTIDDDAYTLLNDYLETLDHVFHDSDNEEIIPDIENRIAEIFSKEVAAGKVVIVLEDVESVIARIGKPEELVDIVETETINKHENASEKEEAECNIKETIKTEEILPPPPYISGNTNPIKKKLFRDSQNGMVGGVCAGLAEYLNFDVTWIRLIAVGLVFLSFFSYFSVLVVPVTYIILWIVLPDASTPLQRMQMMGDSPTLSNIGKSVTGQFRQNNNIDKELDDSKHSEKEPKRIADNIASFFGTLGKILLWMLIIIAIPIEIALALGLIGSVFALILFGTALGSDFYFIEGITNENEIKMVMLALVTAIGYIFVFGIPLYLFILRVLSPNRKPFKRVTKISMGIIWAMGFIVAAVTTGLWISYNDMKANDIFAEGKTHKRFFFNEDNVEITEIDGFKFVDEIDSISDSITASVIEEVMNEGINKDSLSANNTNSLPGGASTKKK